MPDPTLALQLLVSGIVLGSTYALLAVSFGVIFSTTRIFHLAHAVVYTIGAYGAVLSVEAGLPLVPGLLTGLLAAVVAGVSVDIGIYRPMRQRSVGSLPIFLTALGLQIAGTSLIQIVFGPRNRDLPGFPSETLSVGNVTVTTLDLTKVVVSWMVIGLLLAFVRRGRYGKAITATRTNRQMAMAVGVPVERVIALVFALGSLLAGVAALLFTLGGAAFPSMGLAPVLTGFIAVFLGGIDRPLGAAVGGLVLGLASSLSGIWLSGDFSPVVVFGVLFVLLTFRPQGLLGKQLT